MERIPRKIKKKIPLGLYCYTPKWYDNTTGIYHIKPCPFYTRKLVLDEDSKGEVEGYWIGWCNLKLKEYNHEIDDQCKNCGEKFGVNNHRNIRFLTRLNKYITKNKWKF